MLGVGGGASGRKEHLDVTAFGSRAGAVTEMFVAFVAKDECRWQDAVVVAHHQMLWNGRKERCLDLVGVNHGGSDDVEAATVDDCLYDKVIDSSKRRKCLTPIASTVQTASTLFPQLPKFGTMVE